MDRQTFDNQLEIAIQRNSTMMLDNLGIDIRMINMPSYAKYRQAEKRYDDVMNPGIMVRALTWLRILPTENIETVKYIRDGWLEILQRQYLKSVMAQAEELRARIDKPIT